MIVSPKGITKSSLSSRMRSLSFAFLLASMTTSLLPQSVQAGRAAGEYEVVTPDSLASAMMMGLVTQDTVYILDKVEGNFHQSFDSGNTPVWGSLLNLGDNTVRGVKVSTNTFCAAGGSLGNGTQFVAGGNNAVGVGGAGVTTAGSGPYFDYDGRKAVRLLDYQSDSSQLAWVDGPSGNQMQSYRWYPGIEGLADGSVVLIGGYINGGYINRNYPNVDPAYSGTPGASTPTNMQGGSNPTYEHWPAKNGDLQVHDFVVKTSGLNSYPHTYLLPSGRIFMQANYSATIWDSQKNTFEDLPDMTGKIVRVYPASGAAAMLPLTKANNYTPTILFCGGQNGLNDQEWGDYAGPKTNTLDIAASTDCSSITPENADGSTNTNAAWNSEEQMPVGRTMGQFIHLPDGTMVIVNGAAKGTAGYYNTSFNMLAGGIQTEGLAQDPTYTPLLYDPEKPIGSRLSDAGFGASTIARLYHSSALVLPDGAVLVGGSNPHVDVVTNMPTGTTPQAFNTTFELEKWYPPYYFQPRPGPQGMPDQIGYGGSPFNITMDAAYMGASANYKANNTKMMIIRPGFSTHAMNMGQRSLQLEHTYTVNDDGTVSYMINPLPVNANLVVPGPALFFVTIDGVPSVGKFVQLGDLFGKAVPAQVTVGAAPGPLPTPINNSKYDNNPTESALQNFGIGKLVAIIAAAVVVILVIVVGLLCWRRRANKNGKAIGGSSAGLVGAAAGGAGAVGWATRGDSNGEYKRVNTPASSIRNYGPGNLGNQSTASLGTWDSYRMQDVGTPTSGNFDAPNSPRMGHNGESLVAAGAGAGLAAGASAASRARSPLALKPATGEDDNFGGGSNYAGSNYGDSQQQYHDDHSNSGYDQNQQRQGWGEHQAGDAGAYYQDNTDRYNNQGHQAVDGSTGYAAGAYYDDPSLSNNDYNQGQNYNDPYSNDQYGNYSSGGGNGGYSQGGGNYNSSSGGGNYGSSGGGNYGNYGNGGYAH